MQKKNPEKLHLGCGKVRLEGFENIDIHWTQATDKVFDLRRTLPYKDSSVEIIFSEHVFEHFLQHELEQIFRECQRMLKPEGKLLFSIPDFEELTSVFLNRNLKKKELIDIYKEELAHFNVSYKNSNNIKIENDDYLNHLIHQVGEHKLFYTFDLIYSLLFKARFKRIKKRNPIKGLDGKIREKTSLMFEVVKD